MRQPEDNKTIDMLEQKRGRGRPRKEHALTPAERARRYRERKSEQRELFSRDAPRHVTEKDNKVFFLECRIRQLEADVESYKKFCADNAAMLESAQQRIIGLLADQNKREVAENSEDAEIWRGMYEAQLERTVELEARIKSNRQKLTYAKLTQVAEASIVKYMSEAESEPVHFSRVQLRAWAYGIFSLWSKVTYGFRPGRDYERLQDLVTNNRDASR